jgi:hypothetical protein
MRDVIGKSLSWLAEQREKFTSVQVVIRRGSQTSTARATIATSRFDAQDSQGNSIVIESRDYLVSVDDYVLDGIPVEPAQGDVIVEGGYDNQVCPPAPNMTEWSWTNPYRNEFRIHTKPVKSPTPTT